jgi:membrane protease YdiL (CAAX protease family)
MVIYSAIETVQNSIPNILLFLIIAVIILLPIELGIILYNSKKEMGKYSLKICFVDYTKLKWWKIFLIGFMLFCLAGIFSLLLAPLENKLFEPIMEKAIENYTIFDIFNFENLKQYSNSLILVTCIFYFVFNVIIGPFVEELFFRGLLTSRIKRLGNFAPVLITILFSLYHIWLPFNNLFRIAIFIPTSFIAWKKKNIYISLVFHILCNVFSSIGFIAAIYFSKN